MSEQLAVLAISAYRAMGKPGELRAQQGEPMLALFKKPLFRAGIRSKRGAIELGEIGKLARSGTAVWILTQEKARLDYLAAKEEYERIKTRRAYKHFTDRLLQLQSTNAIVTALMNEHRLEQMLFHSVESSPGGDRASAR